MYLLYIKKWLHHHLRLILLCDTHPHFTLYILHSSSHNPPYDLFAYNTHSCCTLYILCSTSNYPCLVKILCITVSSGSLDMRALPSSVMVFLFSSIITSVGIPEIIKKTDIKYIIKNIFSNSHRSNDL